MDGHAAFTEYVNRLTAATCTCTPNDVCYPCYARRRYDDLPDSSMELNVRLIPTIGPMSTERINECSITSHCFVSNQHTGESGCIMTTCATCDGMLAGRCYACGRRLP